MDTSIKNLLETVDAAGVGVITRDNICALVTTFTLADIKLNSNGAVVKQVIGKINTDTGNPLTIESVANVDLGHHHGDLILTADLLTDDIPSSLKSFDINVDVEFLSMAATVTFSIRKVLTKITISSIFSGLID